MTIQNNQIRAVILILCVLGILADIYFIYTSYMCVSLLSMKSCIISFSVYAISIWILVRFLQYVVRDMRQSRNAAVKTNVKST